MREKKTIIELTQITTEEYRRKAKFPVVLLCDNIRSAHNVGSLFRTSDAFLVEEIILSGITPTPPHPDISKTALGAQESVKWRRVEDSVEEAKNMRRRGYKLLCLEQAHDSINPDDYKVSKDEKYVLIAGNEVEGVSQELVDMCDVVLEIPQHGVKHSLNVSVSAAIALYHLTR
ncbi:MAG: RNA methyltransferase [Prevotella sp.]|nr:RNA methyltransferase [Bacteroides sp.]MCM1366795.1 RNA methyltransferase [Prevotella sp.]MCM1437469.1 RNA methyltransferase [Prevotella sp.]